MEKAFNNMRAHQAHLGKTRFEIRVVGDVAGTQWHWINDFNSQEVACNLAGSDLLYLRVRPEVYLNRLKGLMEWATGKVGFAKFGPSKLALRQNPSAIQACKLLDSIALQSIMLDCAEGPLEPDHNVVWPLERASLAPSKVSCAPATPTNGHNFQCVSSERSETSLCLAAQGSRGHGGGQSRRRRDTLSRSSCKYLASASPVHSLTTNAFA